MKKITLLLALWSISSIAFAHTVIKEPAIEGRTSYNGFVITHGCGYLTKPSLGVIAQSVVFPNGPNAIVIRADTEAPVNLSDVLIGGRHTHGLLNPGAIQDHDVFLVNHELIDETGVVRAIHYSNGYLSPHLTGVLPFYMSGVTFVEESCVIAVRARIAIANWCHHRAGNRRADIWIGELTPVFNDADVVSIGFWPTLTIHRNLAVNPLPASCGEGHAIIVEPSAAAIDRYLPVPGFIPGGPSESGVDVEEEPTPGIEDTEEDTDMDME